MKTFADYIFEGMNYDHSDECYNLKKECYELELMEQYIENQQLRRNNPELITESADPSYFTESTSDQNLQLIMEQAEEKKKGIGATIKAGFIKILTALRNLVNKIIERLSGAANAAGTACRDAFSQAGQVADDGMKGIQATLNGAAQKLNGFVIKAGQPFSKKVKKKFPNTPEGKKMADEVAAGISNEKIIVDVSKNTNGTTESGTPICALSIEQLRNVMGTNVPTSDSEVAAMKARLDSELKRAYKHGVTVDLDPKSMAAAKDDLSKFIKTFSETDPEKIPPILKAIYGIMNKVIALTIQLYTSIPQWNMAICSALKKNLASIIGKVVDKKNGGSEGKPAPEGEPEPAPAQ